MKLNASLALAVLLSTPFASSLAPAQPHHEGGGGGHPGPAPVHAAPAPMHAPPPRAAPPAFQAHAVGIHPHGPIVRPHAVRVLGARVVNYGGHQWRHWEHPEFSRPLYYWDWNTIHQVTCIAEDSYGDQYPVTESTFAGFGLSHMTQVEDDALDRCNAESGGDTSCYLATCSHF